METALFVLTELQLSFDCPDVKQAGLKGACDGMINDKKEDNVLTIGEMERRIRSPNFAPGSAELCKLIRQY